MHKNVKLMTDVDLRQGAGGFHAHCEDECLASLHHVVRP